MRAATAAFGSSSVRLLNRLCDGEKTAAVYQLASPAVKRRPPQVQLAVSERAKVDICAFQKH